MEELIEINYIAVFPQTKYQYHYSPPSKKCFKISYNDKKKKFASDLKNIYLATTESQALENLDKVNEKWEEKYPNSMSSWYQN